MRINRYISQNLSIARRQADDMIKHGAVKINNNLAVLGDNVLETDKVQTLRKGFWRPVTNITAYRSKLIYKPRGYLTTRSDPRGRKIVFDLLDISDHDLKPAGRLDYDSEGLLVFSNDGNTIQQLTHPSFEHDKVYLVGLLSPLTNNSLEKIRNGVIIDDYQTKPVKVEPTDQQIKNEYKWLKLEPKYIWYTFTLHEGRNQQIRKTCLLFDNPVARLIRIQHSDFVLTQEHIENTNRILISNKLKPNTF